MNCIALTKKKKPCKNPATLPKTDPKYCWLHIPKQDVLEELTITPKPIKPQLPKKPLIIIPSKQPIIAEELIIPPKFIKKHIPHPAKKPLIIPSKQPIIHQPPVIKLPSKQQQPKQPKIKQPIINEQAIHDILQLKQEIYSIINELYKQGLQLYKGNRDLAIDYIKARFTYEHYLINFPKLQHGLNILTIHLDDLLQSGPEYLYFNGQIAQLNKLIQILEGLYNNKGNPNAFEQALISYEMDIISQTQLIESAPKVEKIPPKITLPVKTKIPIALLKSHK